MDKNALQLDLTDRKKLLEIVNTTLGTKLMSRFGDRIANLAIDAVQVTRSLAACELTSALRLKAPVCVCMCAE